MKVMQETERSQVDAVAALTDCNPGGGMGT